MKSHRPKWKAIMSLHNYRLSASHKDLAERAIVQKREQDAERQKKLESAARYHRDMNRLSSQYKKLDDQQSGKASKVHEESRLIEEVKFNRKQKLLERREKLAKLLSEEDDHYLAELKDLGNITQENDPWNIKHLKEQIELLQKRRDEEEEELRKKNYCHLFHETNIPYVKEHTTRLSEDEVQEAVETRKKYSEEQALKRQTDEERQLDDLENFKDENIKTFCAIKYDIRKESENYVKLHQEKMDLYEENKRQIEALDNQFQLIDKYQNVIDGVKKKRQKVQEIQRQKMEKISGNRPSKEKVRSMCVEMNHGLELDMATLNYLSKLEFRHREIIRVNLDKVTAASNIIQRKMEIQNKYLEEVQLSYEEEATKCWDKWKSGWDMLLNNQDEIMEEVFNDLINQLEQVVVKIDKLCRELTLNNKELLSIIKKMKEDYDEKMKQLVEKENCYSQVINQAEQRIARITNARKSRLHR